ncbi:MAG: T9SS C-terminal target domain-containing protein, partial [Flavobacteriales bacterium]|nr:T9SS C-terminal target domain-containing protein [Flavobacteriales bacterium]
MKGLHSAIPTRTFALCLALTLGAIVHAKEPPRQAGMAGNSGAVGAAKAAACSPASQVTQLNFNNVRAVIENGGNVWTRRGGTARSGYEVPKTDDFSGPNAIYAGSLWMGGLSSAGQLKIAAVLYRADGNDFWPGPLTNDGLASVTSDVCAEYDKFYTTSRAQAEAHIQWYNCQQDPDCDLDEIFPDGYSVPPAFVEWPANGNVDAGQDLHLAPFIDVDGDEFYDPFSGDYPDYGFETSVEDCKNKRREDPVSLFGDNNIYWIFNDKGDAHTETLGQPIGLEVRAQAFSFNANDEINNMTFYNYTVINQGSQTLTNTYFGHFVDADLGCPDDDFVGCDIQRGLGFAYNWQDVDATCQQGQSIGYGAQPPAIGVDFFEGPYQDADGVDNPGPLTNAEVLDCIIARDQDGIPYKGLGIGYGDSVPDNERFGMRAFIYFNREGNANLTDPDNASHFYNYLQSVWKNNRPQTYGGNGYSEDPNAVRAYYMFPWDSDVVGWGTNCVTQADWRETTPTPALPDRRFVQSAGPFTLEPGAYNNVTVGVVFARASSGGAAASVGPLRVADDKAQALFDNCFKILDGPDAPDLVIQELDKELIIYLVNPQGSNNENEEYVEVDPIIPEQGPNGEMYDREYRFQGYKVYQLRDATVSVADLDDIESARLVYQGDLEDGVGQLINYDFNDQLGLTVPSEQVNGADAGVVHAIRITEDRFAQGNPALVNFKSYYYLAISYGYNNYAPFNPADGTGQAFPYVAGRKAAFGSIRSYVGIPHKPSPEQGGTAQNADFGDAMQITRLEGQGNGGLRLEMEQSTVDAILSGSPWRQDQLKYKVGSGPIEVRVVDPLAVPDAQFEVWFQDSITPGDLNDAYWYIVNLSTNDTVFSDRAIDLRYEQLLLKWGLSVRIGQVQYTATGSGGTGDIFTEPIGSGTLVHKDQSLAWFGGISDAEGVNPQNWIRSGIFEALDADVIYNDRVGKDNDQLYEAILGGTWAPWALVGQAPFQPSNTQQVSLSQSSVSPIAETPSIQLVITADKSKWTRAVVLEQEADVSLSEGGAAKLSLRASPSIDKNGRKSGSPGVNEDEATLGGAQPTGAGWFPGYAIDLETGERLNMAYGENSFWGGEIGRDMIWNPSDVLYTSNGDPVFGGCHWIYVFKNDRRLANADNRVPAYDECRFIHGLIQTTQPEPLRRLFRAVSWVGSAIRLPGTELLATDVTIVLNTKQPYKSYGDYAGTPQPIGPTRNNGLPLYTFGTAGYEVGTNDNAVADASLDIINVVPNPYYGFSGYEQTRLDNRVKFINLPQVCTISIYNVSGTLVRKFRKDNDLTYLDWDLKN